MKLTCYAIESGKLTKGQRWRLLMPNKKRERSAFRTDGKSRDDVVAAGKYVAAKRGKRKLYGWMSVAAEVFRDHGLEPVCDLPDKCAAECIPAPH